MVIRVSFFGQLGRWLDFETRDKMASNHATYKLFPRKWYSELTPKQFEKARTQLTAYATSKELDTGLSEVSKTFLENYQAQMRSKDAFS